MRRRAALGCCAWLLACEPSPREPASPSPPAAKESGAKGVSVGELVGALEREPSVLEYREVDELGPAQRGRQVRVHGWVMPGTIAQRSDPPTLRFTLGRGDASVVVEHRGPVPDRFQERLETIVTGELSQDGTTLRSEDLVAKCPDDYQALPKWPDQGGPR